jgi:hypothetical protein
MPVEDSVVIVCITTSPNNNSRHHTTPVTCIWAVTGESGSPTIAPGAMSVTTKQASCSSTDHGGGKRRAGIDFRMENRGGTNIKRAAHKTGIGSAVIGSKILKFRSFTDPPPDAAGFLLTSVLCFDFHRRENAACCDSSGSLAMLLAILRVQR